MRTLLMLGLAVVGLQFGCGGDEALPEAPTEMASQEAALLICTSEFFVEFYSDATYTTQVGTERCYCGRTPSRTGVRTAYYIEYGGAECPALAP
ncbi:hypothetical protein [Myxococcus faecalis]|uniref:hypothetical protein n=1 Tax=Myxococcus faecalis TaxID=3115646 RepID=UPI003CF51F38